MFIFVALPCFDLGPTIPCMYVHACMVGTVL